MVKFQQLIKNYYWLWMIKERFPGLLRPRGLVWVAEVLSFSLFQPQLSTLEELFCARLSWWNERLFLRGQDRRAKTEVLQQNSLIENMQSFQWYNTSIQGTWAQTLTGVLAIMNIFKAFMTRGWRPAPSQRFSVTNFLSWPSVHSIFTVVLFFTR